MKKMNIAQVLTSCLVCCGIAAATTSCNDEWKDEQYEKYISFKAPLNDNGVTAVYVPYSRHNDDGSLMYGAEGRSSYDLPVIVAGTTRNDRNLTVHVGHSDTLTVLNYERFGSPTYRADIVDLYYRDMSDYASYPETMQIQSGQPMATSTTRAPAMTNAAKKKTQETSVRMEEVKRTCSP